MSGGSTQDQDVVEDSDVREASFTVVYDGPALAEHSIEVRYLAPALLAVGALVEEANRICNGDRAKVSLAVRATPPGSFEIDLQLIQTLLQQAKGLLISEPVTAALNLKEILFGGGVLSFFGLLKALRGRKPKSARKDGNNLIIEIDASTHITVSKDVYALYESTRARNAAAEIVRPLDDEGITTLQVRDADIIVEEVLRDDRASFAAPLADEPAREELLDETFRKALTVISPDFKEGNKWRVSDGQHEFYVSMLDVDFNAQVERGEVDFTKGDVLICKLRSIQTRTGAKLSTEYEALAVLNQIKRPRQRTLDELG